MASPIPEWGSKAWVAKYIREHGFPPIAGGDGAEDPPDDPPQEDPADPKEPAKEPEGGKTAEPDWKAESRKHEKRAKTHQKRIEELESTLKEREDADKSDREKEIEKARTEAKAEGRSEVEKERRHDRLDIAATKVAVKGIKVGEGDDAKTVKFADPDDALIYVDRAIAAGDLDESEIFDKEGKVQTEALTEALREILESKPHLRATEPGNGAAVRGNADAGRGSSGGKDIGAMSVDDHFKAVNKTATK